MNNDYTKCKNFNIDCIGNLDKSCHTCEDFKLRTKEDELHEFMLS